MISEVNVNELENAEVASPVREKIEDASVIIAGNILGSHTVSIYDLHLDVFRNPRESATFEHIEKLRISLENKEQVNRVLCSLSEKDGAVVLGVFGGFTRIEAMTRTALRPVITEWNESHGYSQGDKGYISPVGANMGYEASQYRNVIKEAGGEWAEKFDAALKNHPVRIDVMPAADDKSTFMRSFIDNFCRENQSVWSTCQSMEFMRAECGYTGKDLADAVGVSQANISQFNTIYSLPEQFAAMVEERQESENLPESLVDLASEVVDAFVRGVSIPQKEPGAISFSCARYIATAIRNRKKNALTVAKAVMLLRLLTKLNDVGKPDPTMMDVDPKAFEQKVKSACEKSVVLKEFNPESQLDSALNSVNVEDLIAAQNAKESDIVINEPDIDDGIDSAIDSLLTESGADLEPPSAVDNAIASTLATLDDTSDEDEVEEGETDDEDDDDDDEEDDNLDALANSLLAGIEDDSDDDEESLSDAAGEDDDEEEEEETGAKKTKTVETVQPKLETKPAQKILNKIHQCVLLIHTELEQGQADMDWIDIVASISECAAMADCVGSGKLSSQFETSKISVTSGLSDLLKRLIDHAKKTMPGEKYQTVMSLLPKITKEDFPIL